MLPDFAIKKNLELSITVVSVTCTELCGGFGGSKLDSYLIFLSFYVLLLTELVSPLINYLYLMLSTCTKTKSI